MPVENQKTVLIVEDSKTQRMLMRFLLRSLDYQLLEAQDAEEALAILSSSLPDAILLDWELPGVSGPNLLKALKDDHRTCRVPVLMVTSHQDPAKVSQILEAGAVDFIRKPPERVELQARLKSALKIKEYEDELYQHNQFILKIFGRYLTEEIVEQILGTEDGLAVGGAKRRVTIMMTDLRGFTAMSERLEPEHVLSMLNIYLEEMTTIIHDHKGTIIEILGDALLVLFGSPIQRDDDAERAAVCAIAMQRAMPGVNETLAGQGYPVLSMGIGVNTGNVVVGNIGSIQRSKYGVVGSHVNLTGRIESVTVGEQILISESTLEDIDAQVTWKGTNQIRAKGFKDPITVYDLTGVGGRHGIHLVDTEIEPATLEFTIPVRYTVVLGKRMITSSAEGRLLRLSETTADLLVDAHLEPLTDLKIELPDAGSGGVSRTVYAKVLTGRAAGYRIRFTSKDPGAVEYLDSQS